MRIRTTTGPSASPPPGRNKDSNDHKRLQRISTLVARASIGDGRAATLPLRSTASITAITVILSGGDR